MMAAAGLADGRAGLRTDAPVLAALAALLLGSCLLSLWLPPVGDMPWRLHVAREVLGGAEVYRDVIETNPPLWFWAALPTVWIAEQTGLPSYAVLVVLVHLSVAALIPLWDRLTRGALDPVSRRAGWFALATAALLVPVGELGQREPAAMLAALMWIALATARVRGAALPWPVVVAASLVAAYGFALKHYFILIPVLVELALAWRLRSSWRPVRLETVILGSCALAYALSVVTLTPAFLSSVVPLVSLSYGSFGPGAVLGTGPVVTQILLGSTIVLLGLFGAWRTGEKRPLVWAILASGVAFALIAVVQLKGWRYHLLAAQGCGLVGLVLVSAAAAATPRRLLVGVMMACGLIATAVMPLRSILATGGVRAAAAIEALIEGLPPGQRLMILDYAPETAFLYPVSQGHIPASRHYSLWMLPGLGGASGAAPSPQAALERALVLDELRADIACQQADWIVIGTEGVQRDLPAILQRDPATRQILASSYIRQPDIESYQLWRRVTDAPPPPACQPLRPLANRS